MGQNRSALISYGMSWGPSIVSNCDCQDHTNYIRSVTPQEDYFAHQDLMHASIIFKQAQLVWTKDLLGLWSSRIDGMGDVGRQPGDEVRNNLGETLSSTCAVHSETRSISWRRISLLWRLYNRTSQTFLLWWRLPRSETFTAQILDSVATLP